MSKIKEPIDRINAANAALLEPVQEKLIAYSTYNLTSENDNVGRLLPKIVSSPLAEGYTHVCAVYSFNERFTEYREKHSFPANVRFVAFDSEEYIRALHTAKRLVSDGRLPTYYVRRKEQEHLNLFSHKSFLYQEEIEDKFINRTLTKLNKSIAMSTMLTCESEQAAELMTKKLYIEDFFRGRLIKAALPEMFPVDKEETADEDAAGTETAETKTAKYTPEAIEALREKYRTAEEEEPEEELPADYSAFIGEDIPEEEASAQNIISVLFTGEGEFFPARTANRRRLLFVAYLAGQNEKMLELRNLVNRIDTEKNSVTVYSYRTTNTALCRTFAPGVRVVVRNDYVFNAADIGAQAEKMGEGGFDEKKLWQLDLERAAGSDKFDDILVYDTANPYWHRLCEAADAERKTFAAVSVGAVMELYPDAASLAEIIDRTYDRLLTADGDAERLNIKNRGRLPIVYSDCWKDIRHSEEEFKTACYKGKQYYLLQNKIRPLEGCTLIPKPESWDNTVFCPVVSEEDAKAVSALFEEVRKEKPELRMYLHILTDEKHSFKDIGGEGVTVISGKRIPLLLVARCSSFVYPYTEDTGLCATARLMGTAAAKADSPKLLKLALAGPTNGMLYSGYTPQMPEEPVLVNDKSIFSCFEMTDAELDGYETAVTLAANEQLFSTERQ